MSQLSIVHWNDSYRISPQKVGENGDTIDVTQFAGLLNDIRRTWKERSDGVPDGLSFFSGDLFSPSLESTVTRGSHLVPVMNELAPDIAVAGNHDFDFGYPHLSELIRDNKFPWLLSNIIDENTNTVPEPLHSFKILERSGVRVGVIGLVEEQWITTIPSWPANFRFKEMAETGRELSQKLRGEHQCDLIIALTHCRVPNDIKLAKDLLASSPSAQDSRSVAGEHGVDILLGGHDHFYFVSKGVTSWRGYDVSKSITGAEGDDGNILIVKSGTEFRDLTELTLELSDTSPGSVRKKVIKAIHGMRHEIKPGMPASENMQKIVRDMVSSVSETLAAPVCTSQVELNVASDVIRRNEMPVGNWIADVLRHAYDDALSTQPGGGGSDGVLISAGTLRGDSLYPPGPITLGNILEMLPFDDPVVVIEVDGETLWDAFEQALSQYPARAGRFPIVSGFRVSWDSRREPGQRVLGIWLLKETPSEDGISHALVDGEAVKREKNGRTYKIITREYLATGHDGYTALAGHPHLIDEEHGQIMSSLVRKYLLGAHYVNKMVHSREKSHGVVHLHLHLHLGTADIIKREMAHRTGLKHKRGILPHVAEGWHHAAASVLHRHRSRSHYRGHFNISVQEHMTGVDPYDGKKVRQGSGGKGMNDQEKICEEDLLVIHPVVDGRLKDVARD